uniref:Uncharacterized protein n=1 Tax=Rhizophora mucronata TaxID=61149 RepID=A0A2P2QJW2_RHIMU
MVLNAAKPLKHVLHVHPPISYIRQQNHSKTQIILN